MFIDTHYYDFCSSLTHLHNVELIEMRERYSHVRASLVTPRLLEFRTRTGTWFHLTASTLVLLYETIRLGEWLVKKEV